MKTIQAALAAFILAAAQPAFAETLHIRGVPVPPIQTVEQARAETEKRLAAIQAEEAMQAAEAAAQLATRDSLPAANPQETFFTGKPLLEETGQYAFLFRDYDPELARWTSADPSGFPDGANNAAYMAVPTSEFDWQGLQTKTATLNFVSDAGSFSVRYALDYSETSAPSLQTQTLNGGVNLIVLGVRMELHNGRLTDVEKVFDDNGIYNGWTGTYKFEVIVYAWLGFNWGGQTIGAEGERIQKSFETAWHVE